MRPPPLDEKADEKEIAASAAPPANNGLPAFVSQLFLLCSQPEARTKFLDLILKTMGNNTSNSSALKKEPISLEQLLIIYQMPDPQLTLKGLIQQGVTLVDGDEKNPQPTLIMKAIEGNPIELALAKWLLSLDPSEFDIGVNFHTSDHCSALTSAFIAENEPMIEAIINHRDFNPSKFLIPASLNYHQDFQAYKNLHLVKDRHGHWYVASLQVLPRQQYSVHFLGWSSRYDETLDVGAFKDRVRGLPEPSFQVETLLIIKSAEKEKDAYRYQPLEIINVADDSLTLREFETNHSSQITLHKKDSSIISLISFCNMGDTLADKMVSLLLKVIQKKTNDTRKKKYEDLIRYILNPSNRNKVSDATFELLLLNAEQFETINVVYLIFSDKLSITCQERLATRIAT